MKTDPSEHVSRQETPKGERNSFFPGWLRDSDLFGQLTVIDLRLLIMFYGHARAADGKLWPFSKTLLRNKAFCQTSLGTSKMRLARLGLLCFGWDRENSRGHTIWMAMHRPWDFRANTMKPEFAEYRRVMQGIKRKKPTSNRGWFKPGNKQAHAARIGRGMTDTRGMTMTEDFGRGQNAAPRRESSPQTDAEQSRERCKEPRQMSVEALRATTATPGKAIPWTATATATSSMLDSSIPADSLETDDLPGHPLPEDGTATKRTSPHPSRKEHQATPRVLPETQQVVNHHAGNYLKRFGRPYCYEPAKDLTLAKRLLADIPIEDIKRINDFFFEVQHPFINASDYSFGIFSTNWNVVVVARKYAMEKKPTPRPPSRPLSTNGTNRSMAGMRTLIHTTATEKIYEEITSTGKRIIREPRNRPPHRDWD